MCGANKQAVHLFSNKKKQDLGGGGVLGSLTHHWNAASPYFRLVLCDSMAPFSTWDINSIWVPKLTEYKAWFKNSSDTCYTLSNLNSV